MQIFPRELNYLPLALALVAGGLGAGVFILFWVYFTPPNLQVGYTPKQPVDYSHRLHAGELGMDCRYCHSQVERSAKATVPPTQTCMGCHAVVRTESEKLAPVRESWETDESIAWIRVHQLAGPRVLQSQRPSERQVWAAHLATVVSTRWRSSGSSSRLRCSGA